ncbi:MAG: AIR synthase family protein [Candidatus Auribacterota bacterium]|nr:AIR synthase family protein [Candidatus Auribacterota bacterium]
MSKFSNDIMNKYIFSRFSPSKDVVVGPGMGIDVAITRLKDKMFLVSHLDPIVGAIKRIGWLAVHIACNDIATAGVSPSWILPLILLPEQWEEKMLDEITKDILIAAKETGVSVIGGHTGYAPGSLKPLVAITALGISEGEYITAAGAKDGDAIVITKGAGIEGTAIIAEDFGDILKEKQINQNIIRKAKGYINDISVIPEALIMRRYANAMHDATRGGVMEALLEIANASGVDIEVYRDRIPVREETKIFSERLDFDPLWMIGSGALVISLCENKVEEALQGLADLNIAASCIGRVKKGKGKVLLHEGNKQKLHEKPIPEKDELAKLWRSYPRT